MGAMALRAGKATPPMSRATSSRAFQAFTLIELIVVLFVLLLITTAIVPSVVALQRSRRLKSLEARIIRLPLEARNEAARSGTPMRLRVDGAALVLDRAPTNGESEEIKRVALGNSVQVEDAQQGGRPIGTDSWQWTVYPDGSAEDGGLQFVERSTRKSLVLFSDGRARWLSGDLPDQSQDRWPVGQLQQRTF